MMVVLLIKYLNKRKLSKA